MRRQSRLALLIGGLLRRVGLRSRKTLRRLVNRLYWTQRQGIRITRETPKARKGSGPRQIHRPSIRQPQHPNNTCPTRPRTFFLPVFAYPFSSESLEYATQLDAVSHAYNRYVVFLPFSRGSTLVRAVHIPRNARRTRHTPHDSQTLREAREMDRGSR